MSKHSDTAALRHLSASDPIMARLAKQCAPLPAYYRERSPFEAVCRIISGQQLSYSAASSIWARMKKLCPKWTAKAVSALTESELRACGLSRNKVAFMREVARRITAGELDLEALPRVSGEEAEERLLSIKGFGPWSVEMYRIFVLDDPDVFSPGDAGLRRAVCTLYGISNGAYERRVNKISGRWKPYRSYACRLLWASLAT